MCSRWFNLPQFLKENENKDINKQTKEEFKKGVGAKAVIRGRDVNVRKGGIINTEEGL